MIAIVKIMDYEGWEISINTHSGVFEAKKDGARLGNKDLELLKEKIKRQNRTSLKFTAIEVIEIENDRVGRITSATSESNDTVYFSYHEAGYEKMKRSQERLNRGWVSEFKPAFALATPENMKILAQIEAKQRTIETLDKEIEKLRTTYKQPIKPETIKKARGLENGLNNSDS